MADPLRIPALPREARRLPQRRQGWETLRQASLAGMAALASAWVLAELIVLLRGF